jgi:hypothetical protein
LINSNLFEIAMSSKFQANFSEYYTSMMSEDTLLKAIVASFNNLGWKHKILSSVEAQASVGMSLWSFGEKLNAKILKGGVVYVESIGNSSIYHNKNKSNVVNFLTQLKQVTLAYAGLEAQTKYQESLKKLKNNPTDASLREITLGLGRIYSDLLRNETGVTAFDEIALMNDINAACAGATFISNYKEQTMPPQSIEDRLTKLKELKAKGLIDENEYNSKRQKILDEV